ncbi:unnamed protein product [Albugo candida]|uniref:Uncharacterized protein n=1 Tax=Albugo candida TaxID=65357 RepID=A0A024G9V7_9STRA|nr:unnamed protein product [Albugo candida]|eukprot:CCI43117.1 unnamed protein product [Albugo candida]
MSLRLMIMIYYKNMIMTRHHCHIHLHATIRWSQFVLVPIIPLTPYSMSPSKLKVIRQVCAHKYSLLLLWRFRREEDDLDTLRYTLKVDFQCEIFQLHAILCYFRGWKGIKHQLHDDTTVVLEEASGELTHVCQVRVEISARKRIIETLRPYNLSIFKSVCRMKIRATR